MATVRRKPGRKRIGDRVDWTVPDSIVEWIRAEAAIRQVSEAQVARELLSVGVAARSE